MDPNVALTRFVRSSDSAQLFYERQGRGRPLLLCDGILCEGHIWKYFVPAFERDWECLHWHYPGHGRSADPPLFSDLSPQRLADDAARVVRHAEVDGVVVVGHSMGVQVALELWRRHRGLVRALVLLCGSPGRIVESFHESAILGYAVPLMDVGSRFLPGATAKLWRKVPSEWVLWLAMHSREVNRRLISAADLGQYLGRMTRVDFRLGLRMLQGAGNHDATPFLPEVDVPVLVVAGMEDRFTPVKRSSLMASAIPNSELMMVPGGTHSLPIEQPDLVNLRVRRFLADRLPG
ncbi:MAG: alpha/beta hydrolase [Deltaproteobacteria bacterium]|nr:alpha/beta hydrolase [Deltaproteobacteria bacterium]